MVPNKSLDEYNIIAALLSNLSRLHGVVFNKRSLKLTLEKVNKRYRSEGIGFLTKTLPRLGKHLDRCLTGQIRLNGNEVGFETLPNSQLPRFLGEFFSLIFQPDGALLQNPCANAVRVLRQVLYLFYKYELPYTDEQEHKVIAKFVKTEQDLASTSSRLHDLHVLLGKVKATDRSFDKTIDPLVAVTRKARAHLQSAFAYFDPTDIYPKHGPGVVATKQKLWDKYLWTNISSRITEVYPMDAYFKASVGHVCDSYHTDSRIGDADLPAKVVLVPKDSRGPRLISCEPVDFQWIQQGLGRAIVMHVESNPSTRDNVRFTDQEPNRNAALFGSRDGRYSTIDLNEASDRVSIDLVRLLFPEHLLVYLEACRSLSTTLPSGEVIKLLKFAPMGSCLCFPILALTVWAILSGGTDDADTLASIYVYGDDVIVPTAYAERAIELLESFGLKANRDKSCTSGLFRESCGMDAFQGVNVTPVRLRTVWSESPSPDVYTSWIAYANSFWYAGYTDVYYTIVEGLLSVYHSIPSKDMQLACPSLVSVPFDKLPSRRRRNKNLQKFEWLVWDVKAPSINKSIDGWAMLLRYFAEKGNGANSRLTEGSHHGFSSSLCDDQPFTVSRYTSRRTSMLVRRWR